MFRRLSNSLPEDPIFPVDLEKLGYFVNEKDQIRKITEPDSKFKFMINRNERFNDNHKEAMNACIRELVGGRLEDLGLETIRLPIGAARNEQHVPILVSKGISHKKRVVVLFGERTQDLGIFSYRTIGDHGINVGSAVDLCTAILKGPTPTSDDHTPGIIIANPGQLLWYRGEARAVTRSQWANLPRKSAVHEPFRVDAIKNTVPGNRTYMEHVQYVFEHVISGIAAANAKFDIIALEYTGTAVLKYLCNHWNSWSSRVNGICLGVPQHTIQDLELGEPNSFDFVNFINKRCRAYFVSASPVETIMTGRNQFGCNCFASGEQMYSENIIVEAWRSMLDWFNILHANPAFEEPEYVFADEGNDQVQEPDTW